MKWGMGSTGGSSRSTRGHDAHLASRRRPGAYGPGRRRFCRRPARSRVWFQSQTSRRLAFGYLTAGARRRSTCCSWSARRSCSRSISRSATPTSASPSPHFIGPRELPVGAGRWIPSGSRSRTASCSSSWPRSSRASSAPRSRSCSSRSSRARSSSARLVVIPFTLPVAISVLAWKWMYDSQFSVINWVLSRIGLIGQFGTDSWPIWLGDPHLALAGLHRRQRVAHFPVFGDRAAGRIHLGAARGAGRREGRTGARSSSGSATWWRR